MHHACSRTSESASKRLPPFACFRTRLERGRWRLIARGEGIHWPDLDEDISVDGLLAGSSSGESQASFQAWLNSRRKRRSNKRLHPPAAASGPPKKPKRGVGRRGLAAGR